MLDPEADWVVDPAELITPAGWSPFAGRRLRGRVIATYARGARVWDGERVLGHPGQGRFVPANGARALSGADATAHA